MWLPRCRTSVNPSASRILQTSRPDRTRSLPNHHLNTGDEHFAVKPPRDLRCLGRFEEQLERFDQVLPSRFNGVALTRDVQFRAERDIGIVLAFDDGRKLARGFHPLIVRLVAIHWTMVGVRRGMTLRNGTRCVSQLGFPQMLNEFDGLSDVGRENRALERSCRNAQEIVNWKLAERVGFLARDFRKSNVYSSFQLFCPNRNDLKRTRNFDIYTATIESKTGVLVEPPHPVAEARPDKPRGPTSWSPDGRRLAFLLGTGTLVVHNLESGSGREYPVPLIGGSELMWEPSGSAVILRATDAQKRQGLHRVDLDSGKVDYLEFAFAKFFSMTDSTVVVTSDRVVLRIPDTKDEQVVDMQGPGFVSARSRDGALLAMCGRELRRIDVLPTSGGKRRSLVRDFPGLSSVCDFSPDGRFLYFVAADDVWRVPVDGGPPQRTGVTLRFIHSLRVNPDGRRLAMQSQWLPSELWTWERVSLRTAARVKH